MRRHRTLFALVALLCACAALPAVRVAAPVHATPACDSGCADLSISVSGPDAGHVGEAIEYDIVVQNDGPDGTPDAVVTDTLPIGAALVSADTTQGSCDDAPGGLLTCDLGALDYPGTATIALTVVPGVPGSNLDSVSVQSALFDPVATNNQDSTDGSMSMSVLGATLTKSGPATATNNSQITYTLTANLPSCLVIGGSCSSTTVHIIDALPAGETLVSVSTSPSATHCSTPSAGTNGTIDCQWASVNIGSGQTLTVTIVAQLSTSAPSVTNQATESDDFQGGETVASNAVTTTIVTSQPTQNITITGQALPALTLVTSGCGTTSPSGTVVTNFAQNVVVTAQPCVGSRFTGWSGGPCNGTTINPCDIGVGTSMTVKANFTP